MRRSAIPVPWCLIPTARGRLCLRTPTTSSSRARSTARTRFPSRFRTATASASISTARKRYRSWTISTRCALSRIARIPRAIPSRRCTPRRSSTTLPSPSEKRNAPLKRSTRKRRWLMLLPERSGLSARSMCAPRGRGRAARKTRYPSSETWQTCTAAILFSTARTGWCIC